jgi:hypothetical protein
MKVGMAVQIGLKHHAYMICGKKGVAPDIMDPLTSPNPEVLSSFFHHLIIKNPALIDI